MLKKYLLILGLLFILCSDGWAQSVVQKVQSFLQELPDSIREATVFPFEAEERTTFSYIPQERYSPALHHFSIRQQQQILEILRASLSESGYWKIRQIMAGQQVMADKEGSLFTAQADRPRPDSLRYQFRVFGYPSSQDLWGWQLQGYHLSVNFTARGSEILSVTPAFLGSFPAVVVENDTVHSALFEKETELGFSLVNALSKKQRRQALFSEIAPPEIITRTESHVYPLDPAGITFEDLSEKQQEILSELLNVYLNHFPPEVAERFKNDIFSENKVTLTFAWAGGMEPGTGHYYRIQGPSLLIEYVNTLNNANHVHTVIRDISNDFGTKPPASPFESEY